MSDKVSLCFKRTHQNRITTDNDTILSCSISLSCRYICDIDFALINPYILMLRTTIIIARSELLVDGHHSHMPPRDRATPNTAGFSGFVKSIALLNWSWKMFSTKCL